MNTLSDLWRRSGGLVPTAIPLMMIAYLIFLAGCTGVERTAFDPRGCPREKEYTKEEQAKIAAALPEAPAIIQQVVVDYGKLRDKSRACRGEKPKPVALAPARRG